MTKETEGSGPYVLTSSVRGVRYIFTARKGYNWGPNGWSTSDNGVPQTITIEIIANGTTATNTFLTGGIQILPFMTGSQVPRILAEDPHVLRALDPDLGAAALIWNESTGAIGSDPKTARPWRWRSTARTSPKLPGRCRPSPPLHYPLDALLRRLHRQVRPRLRPR